MTGSSCEWKNDAIARWMSGKGQDEARKGRDGENQSEKEVESTSPEHKDSASQRDRQEKGESPEESFGWAASMCVSMLKRGSLPGEIASSLGEEYYGSCYWRNGVLGIIVNTLLCGLVSWVVDQVSWALSVCVSYIVGIVVLMMQLYYAAKKAGSAGVKQACWGVVTTIIVLAVLLTMIVWSSAATAPSRSYYY